MQTTYPSHISLTNSEFLNYPVKIMSLYILDAAWIKSSFLGQVFKFFHDEAPFRGRFTMKLMKLNIRAPQWIVLFQGLRRAHPLPTRTHPPALCSQPHLGKWQKSSLSFYFFIIVRSLPFSLLLPIYHTCPHVRWYWNDWRDVRDPH